MTKTFQDYLFESGWTSPQDAKFKVGEYEYRVYDEDEDDVRKKFHYLVKGNEEIDVDWSPYDEMSKEDVALFIKLGMPSRKDIGSVGPLTSDDLQKLAQSQGESEEINRIKNLSGVAEETYNGDDFYHAYGDLWFNEDDVVDEAEYQGRKVQLGKPMQGDVKKFKVYVKDPKTGNVKKVNFGDPDMKIKKSNPKRRKSFRARHNCDNPGPRTKARYWSCRKW